MSVFRDRLEIATGKELAHNVSQPQTPSFPMSPFQSKHTLVKIRVEKRGLTPGASARLIWGGWTAKSVRAFEESRDQPRRPRTTCQVDRSKPTGELPRERSTRLRRTSFDNQDLFAGEAPCPREQRTTLSVVRIWARALFDRF
jgi:hypothetical protein